MANDTRTEGDPNAPALNAEVHRQAGETIGEAPGPAPAVPLPKGEPQPSTDPAFKRRTDQGEVQGAPDAPANQPAPQITVSNEPVMTAPTEQSATLGPGSSLRTLARIHYGDETEAEYIFEANRDRLISPDAYEVGTVVRIPPARSKTQKAKTGD